MSPERALEGWLLLQEAYPDRFLIIIMMILILNYPERFLIMMIRIVNHPESERLVIMMRVEE